MGAMTFLLPNGVSAGAMRELERACVAGGPDNMPWPTEVRVENDRLIVRRDVDESGALVVPWEIPGAGRVMGATSTLIEQELPYQFGIELARGKVHQLRCQVAEWETGGLRVPPALAGRIRAASIGFGHAVTQPPAEGNQEAQALLENGYQAAEELVGLYVEQMFEARQSRQPRLDSILYCTLPGGSLPAAQAALIRQAFNGLALTFYWGQVEPAESTYLWEPFDRLVQWGQQQSLPMSGGPLIDFSTARLPDWLWLWERDLQSIASFMCDYVETVIKRYAKTVTSWQLTSASNCGTVLGLSEDELLWLTARIVEAARQVDSKLDLTIGIAQPWGEYMAVEDRTHSPFIFADTLIRSGLTITGLDLELLMGAMPRGSYCRDPLETSRLIDLYSLLGVPLCIQLAYPSAGGEDPGADQELQIGAGHWHEGVTPAAQADWAATYAALAICKPSVRAVRWAHWNDSQPHQFPHGGLWTDAGQAKPALGKLRELRRARLK